MIIYKGWTDEVNTVLICITCLGQVLDIEGDWLNWDDWLEFNPSLLKVEWKQIPLKVEQTGPETYKI